MGKEGNSIDHEAIVRRASAGDPEAFRSLVEEYKDLVYMVCFQVVRDSFEAENLTQETFLQVYKSLSKYEFRGFKTWVSRIALNKAIDYKRSRARKLSEASISLTQVEDTLAGEETEAEEFLLKAEEKELLTECMQRIPRLYGNVIRKSYQENKSCKQIAMEENVSVRTIETRLYRGKKMLRECYKELSKI
jgi:RNA polymerase sigma factor (sigma-70 family)